MLEIVSHLFNKGKFSILSKYDTYPSKILVKTSVTLQMIKKLKKSSLFRQICCSPKRRSIHKITNNLNYYIYSVHMTRINNKDHGVTLRFEVNLH